MKNKNFLKKLAAVTLGFVMTLGVGAAGYAGVASETRADSYTLAVSDFSSKSYAANDGAHTKGDLSYTTSNVMQQSSKIQFKKSVGVLYNTQPINGLTGVTLTSGSGLSIYYGTNENPTSGSFTSGCKYFSIKAGGSTGTCTGITVNFEAASKTLSSIAVKTAPTKTTSYVVGEYFDPTGLVITKTYSDNSTEDWSYADHADDFTFSPTTSTPLTTAHNSVSISVGGKTTSQSITVSQPITDWAFKELQFAAGTGQTTYTQDAEFDKTGYLVTLVEHSNTAGQDRSTPISAEDWTPSGFDSSEVGTCDVYAQYSYKGVVKTSGNSVTCTITEKPLEATYIFDSGTFATEFATWGNSYTDHGPYDGKKDCDGDYDATITFHKASRQTASSMPTFATKTGSGSWYQVLDFSFTDSHYYISTIEVNFVQYGTKTPDVALFNGSSASGTALDTGTLGTKNVLTASNLNTTTFCIGYCDKNTGSNVQGEIKNIKIGLIKIPVNYNYTFDNNGGSGSMSGGTQQTSSFTLPQCTFTAPENYVFNAWALNSKTADPVAPGTVIDLEEGDNTIYALWRLNKTLTSVTISGSLSKTSYSTTDTWSHEGLTATANYNDETTEDVTNSAVWSYDPESPTDGTESVTISATYGGKTGSDSYNVTVSKVKLATPQPSYSNKQIVWSDVEHAVSYKGRVGTTGDFVDVTSPYDVSQYSGDGEYTFYLQAIGNDTYADSDLGSANFEVPAITYYNLVTKASDLVAGAEYTIGSYDGSKWNIMTTTESDNNRRTSNTFTVTNNQITGDETILDLKLGGSDDNWTFETVNYISSDAANQGFLNATATTGSNYLQVVTPNDNYGYFTVSFEDSVTLITCNGKSSRNQMFLNGTIISCYTSQTTSYKNVSLFKKVSTAKTVAISVDSLNGFVDADDSTVKVTCGNFTPTDITFTYADGGTKTSEHEASSNIASVSAALSGSIYTLTVDFKAPGSTNVKIDVSGANNLPSLYLNIKAFAVPDSVKVGGGTGISEQEIQYVSEGTQKYVGPGVTVYDASGNAISGAEWKREILEGSDNCVALSGDTRVTAIGEGNATVRYTAVVNGKEFIDAHKDVKFHCIADYIEKVTNITFDDAIVATQGDVIGSQIVIENIITSATGTTHFGTTGEDIDLDEFSFSYSTNRSDAVKAFAFNAEITEDTEETVYVFHDVDKEFMSSFTALVEATTIPVSGIVFNNEEFTKVEDGVYSANIVRNYDSITLDAEVTPDNTTESKEISFKMSQDENGDATLTEGVLSVGSVIGNKIKVTATSVSNPEVQTVVNITVTRETQTVHVNESVPVTWSEVTDPSTLTVGDVVILTGIKNYNTYAAGTYSSGNNVKAVSDALTISGTKVTAGVTEEMIYTLEAGTVDGSVAFKDSAGKYLYAAASGSNHMKSQNSIDDNASFTLNKDGTVVATKSSNRNYMRYNNNSQDNLFSCYASNSSTGTLVKFYKRSGGTSETDLEVSDSLYNAVVTASNKIASGTVNKDNWVSEIGSLSSFTGDDLRILKNGVSNESGNEVEQFLYTYDLLVAQGYNNFLNRALITTHTITIDYNHDGLTENVVYPEGEYKLPTAERKGYDLSYWEVNGEQKQPGDTITITGDVTITANWVKGFSLTESVEFKFTGLDITRFQYVFEGTCPEGTEQYGFLVDTSDNADSFVGLTDEAIKNHITGLTEKNKDKLVIGTSDGSKTVSVMFYYVDTNGKVVKSEVITMSFDSYVTADGFDPSIYGDKYAIAALQYYIAGLQAE